MKSLDTDVIIRFLVNDDNKQSEMVKSLFLKAEKDNESFFICNPVILEVLYVLDSVYEYQRSEILDAFESMLMMKILVFENQDALQHLINFGRKTKIELEDLLVGVISRENGCDTALTFDRTASRSNLFKLVE